MQLYRLPCEVDCCDINPGYGAAGCVRLVFRVGARFESRTRHRLYRLDFCGFHPSLQSNGGIVLRLGPDRFLPVPFHFIILPLSKQGTAPWSQMPLPQEKWRSVYISCSGISSEVGSFGLLEEGLRPHVCARRSIGTTVLTARYCEQLFSCTPHNSNYL